jgi:hypothetical protein
MALKYESQTHYTYIASNTPPDYGDSMECSSDLYTHFVTQVTYGINSFFVFKKATNGGKEQTSIDGKLNIIVNSIPGFGIEGEGRVNLTDSEKTLLNTTNIRMFGDFSPHDTPLPSTFDEAVNFYHNVLPALADDHSKTTALMARL